MKNKADTYEDLLKRVKDLEEELKEKEKNLHFIDNNNWKKLTSIIEHSTNVFYSHTKDNVLTYMSPQVEQLLGYTQEEAKIKWTELLTANPLNDSGRESTQTAINTGKRQLPYELELRRKDGKNIWVEVREAPVVINGKVKYITGTLTDITEKKEAREKLREREQVFKTIFENTGAATCIVNGEGMIILANERFADLALLPLKEIINKKNWQEFVSPDDLEKMRAQHKIRRENNEKALRSYEFKFLNSKKEVKDILLFIDLIPGTSNSLASLVDITSRKNAEREARQHRERYSSLFDQAADGILVGIGNGNIIEANESICILTGYDRSELLGNNINMLFDKKELERQPLRYDLIKAGKNVITERKIQNKKGRQIPVEMNTKKLEDGRMQTLFRDLSTRKKVESALRESEANLAAVIESTEESIFSINKNYELLILNEIFKKEFAQMFGYKLEKGMNVLELSPPEEQKKWRKRYERAFKGEIVSEIEEYQINKSKRYFEINLHPIYDKDSITGISVRGIDITSRIKAEENLKRINRELLAAKEKAEESDKLKSAFLANMSHEIRTPMNGIIGFTELLKEPGLSGHQQQVYIDIIQNSGSRMLNTVNDLIDISRIETGQVELNLTKVNIKNEVENLYEFFAPEAHIKGLQFFLKENLPEPDLVINTDAAKLNSILTNLIKNSIKYTDNGTIDIAYGIEGEFVQFKVADTGPGIPLNKQKVIFDRFRQVDTDTTKVVEGSGLGLSITKAYVELLGGEISLDSQVGKGSVFSFTLPAE
jgi:hypothetical protein